MSQVLIKPEPEEPREEVRDEGLDKLLKQDLDINTEELEDLMDDFDIDNLMNLKKPAPA